MILIERAWVKYNNKIEMYQADEGNFQFLFKVNDIFFQKLYLKENFFYKD